MTDYMVYFSVFVGDVTWPHKAEYSPEDDTWVVYSKGDDDEFHACDEDHGFESLQELKKRALLKAYDIELSRKSRGVL